MKIPARQPAPRKPRPRPCHVASRGDDLWHFSFQPPTIEEVRRHFPNYAEDTMSEDDAINTALQEADAEDAADKQPSTQEMFDVRPLLSARLTAHTQEPEPKRRPRNRAEAMADIAAALAGAGFAEVDASNANDCSCLQHSDINSDVDF